MLMNYIGQPRFSAMLSRMMGMKGQGMAAAPMLAPEIGPSVDVNQMDDPAQFFTRNERLAAHVSAGIGAAVGNYGRMELRNPATSGMLFIVESLLYVCANAGFAALVQTTTDEATLRATFIRDSRWLGVGIGGAAGIMSFGNASPLEPNAGNGKLMYIAPNATGYVPGAFVIPPGHALYVYTSVVNVAISFGGMFWRERLVQQDELATG